jgi:hypothetical protein
MPMNTEGDRRAPGMSRVPFDALVEVGAELGPAFEAQAIDISEEGMHLRTAYLPDIGQPLTFRFDVGPDSQVVCGAEVTWKQELGKGGEFGVRFTNLDAESAVALEHILGFGGPPPVAIPGSRVRMHIEGLGSPMRARVREASQAEITAFSELGFLQVGKQLELEDAQTGTKRPASIDRVEVEIHPESRVPQLVVTLRYDDAASRASMASVAAMEPVAAMDAAPAAEAQTDPEAKVSEARDATREPSPRDAEEPRVDEAPVAARTYAPAPAVEPAGDAMTDDALERASEEMRGAIARNAAKVGPAMAKMITRAKVTVALLAAKRKAQIKDASPIRRTTAPPPGGALHASGRKVVRRESEADEQAPDAPATKTLITKRRAMVAGAIGIAAVLGAVALNKPAPPAPLASAPPPEAVAPASTAPAAAPAESPAPAPMPITPSAPLDPTSLSPAARDDREAALPKKPHVAPFGNGPVAHGTRLHLKMDGPVELLQGASQPTGFTVRVPNRRSLEPAGPLASRDGRIASIRVTNDPNGAELSVMFKDGVPNYQVRAKGDTLEIALAPIGQVADAKSAAGVHAVQAKANDPADKPHGKGHKSGHPKRD